MRLVFIEHKPTTCKTDINDPDTKGNAACDKCDFRSNTFGQLRIHIRNKRCYRLFCKYCPFKTSMTQNFTNHRVYRKCKTKTWLNQVQFTIKNSLAVGRFPCKNCDYKGNSTANLHYHKNNVICFRYKCEHCQLKHLYSIILNHMRPAQTIFETGKFLK